MPFYRVIDLLIKEALGSIRNRKTVEKIFQNRKTAKKNISSLRKKTWHNPQWFLEVLKLLPLQAREVRWRL